MHEFHSEFFICLVNHPLCHLLETKTVDTIFHCDYYPKTVCNFKANFSLPAHYLLAGTFGDAELFVWFLCLPKQSDQKQVYTLKKSIEH